MNLQEFLFCNHESAKLCAEDAKETVCIRSGKYKVFQYSVIYLEKNFYYLKVTNYICPL